MKLDRKQIEKLLSALKSQASSLAQDKGSLIALVDSAKQKLGENPSLKDIALGFKTLLSLLKEYALNRYDGLSWQSIVMAVAAVIYFLNPFDLIPDFLMGGLIDDSMVLAWVLRHLSGEIDRFNAWKKKGGSSKK